MGKLTYNKEAENYPRKVLRMLYSDINKEYDEDMSNGRLLVVGTIKTFNSVLAMDKQGLTRNIRWNKSMTEKKYNIENSATVLELKDDKFADNPLVLCKNKSQADRNKGLECDRMCDKKMRLEMTPDEIAASK